MAAIAARSSSVIRFGSRGVSGALLIDDVVTALAVLSVLAMAISAVADDGAATVVAAGPEADVAESESPPPLPQPAVSATIATATALLRAAVEDPPRIAPSCIVPSFHACNRPRMANTLVLSATKARLSRLWVTQS